MPMTVAMKAAIAAAALAAAALMPALRPAPSTLLDEVAIALGPSRTLIVSRDEITWQLWQRCHTDGGCAYLPKPGRKDEDGDRPFPAVGVNWDDATAFVAWLNGKSGRTYRIPTMEEWQLVSAALPRAEPQKRFTDPRLAWAADYAMAKPQSRKVMPSGAFSTLPNGLRDLDGNVWEWTSTCAVEGVDIKLCPAFVAAGEHESELPYLIRDPVTGGCAAGTPPAHVGLRLVRDL